MLSHDTETTPYECDGLTAYRQRPLAVALPETEAQVGSALEVCHVLQVPVVARGAGTIGCILHLQAGTDTPVRHWIQVLDSDLASARQP